MNTYENSEEIRQDIDTTRRDMGRKIDAIQSQLSPDHLKAKARDMVNEVAESTADSISEYVHNNMGTISNGIATSLKRNPLPTALVGLGLGWLLIESLGDERATTSTRYPIQRYQPEKIHGLAAESERRNPAYNPAYARDVYGNGHNGEGIVDQVKHTISDAADTVQRKASRFVGKAQEQVNETTNAAQRLHDEARLQAHLASMDAKDQIDEWQQKGEALGHQANYEAHRAVQSANQHAQNTANQAGYQAQRAYDSATGYAENAAHQAGNYISHAAEQAGEYANYAGHQAQYYSRRAGNQAYAAGEQVKGTIEDNPLTFGLVSLAVGAAIGMLLPQTRRENEWIGQYSDQVTDAARATASDAMHHAQEAYEEIRPELEKSANKVMNDLKESGRAVASDLQKTGESIKQEAVHIGEQTKQVAEDKAEAAKEDTKEHARELTA